MRFYGLRLPDNSVFFNATLDILSLVLQKCLGNGVHIFNGMGQSDSEFPISGHGAINRFLSIIIATPAPGTKIEIVKSFSAALSYAALRCATLRYAALRSEFPISGHGAINRFLSIIIATPAPGTKIEIVKSFSAALSYAALRCASMRYAALRCATLRYATLRYATLRYDALRYAALRCATLRYAALRCTTL
jgi:hypothetical protein